MVANCSWKQVALQIKEVYEQQMRLRGHKPANVELMVKVLDGTAVNGKHWVFYGALSSVEYKITVTDTQTGKVKVYENPSGRLASVADTSAF